MSKQRSRSRVPLALLVLAATPTLAQNNYYRDCEAARQALQINNPNQLAPCTASPPASPTVPSLTIKQMIQTQVTSSLIDAFVNMLFSNDSQANAQKQKMMAELLARQAEAEKQHKIEEAKRLAEICNQLQATLKLNGLPTLPLKFTGGISSDGGLSLKLGDGSNDRASVQGAPGVYLSGTSDSQVKVVNYLTEPLSPPTPPSGSGPLSGGGLQLKNGLDNSVSSTPAASAPDPSPVPADGAAPPNAVTDVRNMTPQQLADLAMQVSSLPPEEQQRLMGSDNSASVSASATNNTPVPSNLPSAGAANQSALTQLQQTAVTSQAAAEAPGLDEAATLAHSGFDQAIGGSMSPALLTPGTMATPLSSPAANQPTAVSTTARLSTHPFSTSSVGAIQTAPSISPALLSEGMAPASEAALPPATVAAVTDPCPPGVAKMIPSRQELQIELAARLAALESLRNTILRLNRTIQLDQQQFAVWEDEAKAGHDRTEKRLFSVLTQAIFNSIVDKKEEYFESLEHKKALTPLDYYDGMQNNGEPTAIDYYKGRADTGGTEFDRDQLSKLNRAKELNSFSAFKDWVLENKSDWEMIEDGARQLAEALPLTREGRSYLRVGEDLLDTAYDYIDLRATWDNVQQLDHNSMMFLEGVHQNGERMKVLVQRIQAIQAQLNSMPEGPSNVSPCPSVQAGAKAW